MTKIKTHGLEETKRLSAQSILTRLKASEAFQNCGASVFMITKYGSDARPNIFANPLSPTASTNIGSLDRRHNRVAI
jgi:hypothetical protein